MRGGQTILGAFVSGCREICWLYGLALFAIQPLLSRPLAWTLPALIFFSAGLLDVLVSQRPLRNITRQIITIGGAFLAILLMLHAAVGGPTPIWQNQWLIGMVLGPKSFIGVLSIILVVAWTIFILWSGIRHARRPSTHQNAIRRFDKGLAILLALLLMKTLFSVRSDSLPQLDPAVAVWYFSFGLVSILLTLDIPGRQHKRGWRPLSTLLLVGLTACLLLLSVGVIRISHPVLQTTAENGYKLLQSIVSPLGSRAADMLKALAQETSEEWPQMADKHRRIPPAHPPQKREWVDRWTRYGSLVQLSTLLLAVGIGVIVAVFASWRWLLSESPRTTDGIGLWKQYRRLSDWLQRRYHRLLSRHSATLAQRCYRRLMQWGGLSGMPHRPTETPTEYGQRLAYHFPTLRSPIEGIIAAYNQSIYGCRLLTPRQETGLRHDWRVLRQPAWWPTRVRYRLFHRKRPLRLSMG